MNIIVCVKQVTGTEGLRRIAETNQSIREEVEGMINPYDLYAVEEGLRIKEQTGGKVTVLSMGIAKSAGMLRETIGLGVDEAILMNDQAFAGADTLATAYALSMGIRKIGQYDLILCGKQTFDGETAQVAPSLAEKLGIPHVTCVRKIEEIHEGYIRCQRMTEDGHQVIEMKLPAVLSVVKEINEPRLPSLKSMMKAKKAVIPVWTADEVQADKDLCGLKGSPTRIIRTVLPVRDRQSEMIEGEPAEQAGKLVDKLLSVQSGTLMK